MRGDATKRVMRFELTTFTLATTDDPSLQATGTPISCDSDKGVTAAVTSPTPNADEASSIDASLRRLIELWHRLPADRKAKIAALLASDGE